MTDQTKAGKKTGGRRPAASVVERIAEAEKLLATLREQQRRESKESLEKNRKSILDLLRAERLDLIGVDDWKKAMPRIKSLLGVNESPDANQSSTKSEQPTVAETA